MKLRCLVVDDEPIAQNIIKGFIADIPNLELVGICDNALEALVVLENSAIDLLFLDIEMPKLSGLSFLKSLQNPPETIITTAYREFALEGFELSVIDYLLKPFSFERFLTAINKVKNKLHSQINNPDINQVRAYTYFKVDRKNVKVYLDEIYYIEGLSNYVKIHLNEKSIVVYERLIDLEAQLHDKNFLRIHKSYIISLDKIRAYGNDYVDILERQLSIGNTYRDSFAMAKRRFE